METVIRKGILRGAQRRNNDVACVRDGTICRLVTKSNRPRCVNCDGSRGATSSMRAVVCKREFEIIKLKTKYKVERWREIKMKDGEHCQLEYAEHKVYQQYVHTKSHY